MMKRISFWTVMKLESKESFQCKLDVRINVHSKEFHVNEEASLMTKISTFFISVFKKERVLH